MEESLVGIHGNGENTVTKIKIKVKCVPCLSLWAADYWAIIVDF